MSNSFTWSDDQLELFSTALAVDSNNQPLHPLIKCLAVAGAAKTTSLVELSKRYPANNTITYLVFGNANAAEARTAFGTRAAVSTLHALAYHYIFRKYEFPIKKNIAPFIAWRDIPKSANIRYKDIFPAIDLVNSFCLSNEISLATFANEKQQKHVKAALKILDLMFDGTIRITHSGYLKLFHTLVMTKEIEIDPTDVLLIDEFGDITPQTMDIFLAYPAKQKIAVGDPAQSIFSFMDCINGFNVLENRGVSVTLSKSFRVANHIARRVEKFCRKTIDPDFVFEGMDYRDHKIETKAFITRNNMALIEEMIELDDKGISYRLVSKAKSDQLFKLPLFILGMKQGRVFRDPELKELQKTVDEYHKQQIVSISCLKYLLNEHIGNEELKKAIRITSKYSASAIITAKESVDKHKHSAASLTLGTAFVFKGFTFDSVEFHDELNDSIREAMEGIENGIEPTDEQITELKLYYVAATRCRYELNNATYI